MLKNHRFFSFSNRAVNSSKSGIESLAVEDGGEGKSGRDDPLVGGDGKSNVLELVLLVGGAGKSKL